MNARIWISICLGLLPLVLSACRKTESPPLVSEAARGENTTPLSPTSTPTPGAAAPSSTPSETPNSGFGISIPTLDLWTTPTPVPALQAHTWQPGHVLVEFGPFSGDGPIWAFGGDFPPSLILYADGRLILAGRKEGFSYEPMMTRLDRTQICRLLNSIDQSGFFDFDEDSLYSLNMGGSGTYIEVNAWRSKRVAIQSLSEFVACTLSGTSEPCDWITKGTSWLPVVNAYQLLESYRPVDLVPYVPEAYAVFLYTSVVDTGDSQVWPYSSLSIAELLSLRAENGQEPAPLLLDAALVPDWLDALPNGVYMENGALFQVNTRPLWPYEYRPNNEFWALEIPDPSIPSPDFSLSCSPEDGLYLDSN